MKKFLLKSLDIVFTIIMIASSLYAVFNLVMTFLPTEIQTEVYGWLHMSQEYIATFSISSTINAAVLIASKLSQTYTKINLTNKIARTEQVIHQDIAVNEVVIERVNAVINNLNVLQRLNDALLSVQKVTTERNINASDKLVYKSEKDAYKQALEQIEQAKQELAEISNVATVYEKTEIKEVVVEKSKEPKNELSGRV